MLIFACLRYYVLHSTVKDSTFASSKQTFPLILQSIKTNFTNSMNIDNLKSQMRKGMLEFCVLLLLRNGDAYASQIIASMKDAHLIVMEGTLYPLLTRLKNDGLLAYRWEESPSGPPRKYYSLTPLGFQFLEQLKSSWDEISHTVNHILAPDSFSSSSPSSSESAIEVLPPPIEINEVIPTQE